MSILQDQETGGWVMSLGDYGADFKLRSVSKAPCHAASHSAQSP